jgi:hypothetical protein
MRTFVIGLLIAVACLEFAPAYAVDNTINIEQIGDNNTIDISQNGAGHTAIVEIGKLASSNANTVSIEQRDTSTKLATVEIKSGINNSVNVLQQGIGNHTSSILNLVGNTNAISVDQSGAGNHTLSITGSTGTTNSGNNIMATQSGGNGADKTFDLTLGGTSGATVTIQQTNPTQTNSGSMTIQCATGSCGGYSYIRN